MFCTQDDFRGWSTRNWNLFWREIRTNKSGLKMFPNRKGKRKHRVTSDLAAIKLYCEEQSVTEGWGRSEGLRVTKDCNCKTATCWGCRSFLLLAACLLCYITLIHFAALISKVHRATSRPIQFHPTSKMNSTYFSNKPIKYLQKWISKSAARCRPAADVIGLDVITVEVIMKWKQRRPERQFTAYRTSKL